MAEHLDMRILIADDEYLIRASLISMLYELNLPIHSLQEAATGEQMVNLVRQDLPDVAFVDIRMPGLNGLEAIKAAKTLSPQTKWFILTGFPEFEYAHEAIRLGVSGYLLKPISPAELKKILDDFAEEGKKQKIAQNNQFEREMMALLYGLTSLEFEEFESFVSRAQFTGAIFYFDSYLLEKVRAERQFAFCRSIQRIINENLDHQHRLALIVLPNGELASAAAWDSIQEEHARLSVQKYFKALESQVQQLSGMDMAITVIKTKDSLTYPDFLAELEHLQELVPLRVFCELGRLLDVNNLSQHTKHPDRKELAAQIQSLCRSYRDRNQLNYIKSLEHLKKTVQRDMFRISERQRENIVTFLNQSIGTQLSAGQSTKQWVQALEQYDLLFPASLPKDEFQNTDIVDQVIAFMHENYMANIGIGQIAERLNITPNYLSTLFHKKTGINFLTYLKKIRMLKAKELLTDPNVQVHQVAEQVGYFSPRHFARLFAEHYGCLPSEYRDRHKVRWTVH
jgi:two-component system response regulator YesN